MDSELQALREARLSELKRNGAGGSQGGKGDGSGGNGGEAPAIGAAIAPFLEPAALERLSRVSLVRPERAQAVENYLKQLINSGQVSYKIREEEIVQILNGIARDQQKKNDVKIVFNRKSYDDMEDLSGNGKDTTNDDEEDDDDFFD